MRQQLGFHYDLDPNTIANAFLYLDQQSDHPSITQLKLQKLLFLAQAQYLASTGYRLFDEHIEAFKFGPIVPSIHKRFQGRRDIIVLHDRIAQPLLPADVFDFVDNIWAMYGSESVHQLVERTHRMNSWKNAYNKRDRHAVISDVSMARDCTNAPRKQRVVNDNIALVDFDKVFDRDPDRDVKRALTAIRRYMR